MNRKHMDQAGITLVEMMVSVLIGMAVMAGALQIMVQGKSNFIIQREMAALQENARFAFKLLQDEIHMTRFNSCGASAQNVANSIIGAAASWELNGTGIQGFEHEAGTASFPLQIRADVAMDTDALVLRKGDSASYLVSNHTAATSRFNLNRPHDIDPGDIVVVAAPDCQQLGYFQAVAATAAYVTHATGNAVSPGNCTGSLAGTFSCGFGAASSRPYPAGSVLMKLMSHAYYVGPSEVSSGTPALFRERLGVVTNKAATWSEELIQGVENLQVQYGIDVDPAGSASAADVYVNADDSRMDSQKVRSVRVSLRLRSVLPIHQKDIPFDEFEGIIGTDGSDRFMRQTFSTTITLRN